MVHMLSQITTCLGPDALQAILNRANTDASQRVEGEDPAVIKGNQERKTWKYKLLLGKSW